MVYFQIHSASKKLIFKKTTNACICIFNKKLFIRRRIHDQKQPNLPDVRHPNVYVCKPGSVILARFLKISYRKNSLSVTSFWKKESFCQSWSILIEVSRKKTNKAAVERDQERDLDFPDWMQAGGKIEKEKEESSTKTSLGKNNRFWSLKMGNCRAMPSLWEEMQNKRGEKISHYCLYE